MCTCSSPGANVWESVWLGLHTRCCPTTNFSLYCLLSLPLMSFPFLVPPRAGPRHTPCRASVSAGVLSAYYNKKSSKSRILSKATVLPVTFSHHGRSGAAVVQPDAEHECAEAAAGATARRVRRAGWIRPARRIRPSRRVSTPCPAEL